MSDAAAFSCDVRSDFRSMGVDAEFSGSGATRTVDSTARESQCVVANWSVASSSSEPLLSPAEEFDTPPTDFDSKSEGAVAGAGFHTSGDTVAVPFAWMHEAVRKSNISSVSSDLVDLVDDNISESSTREVRCEPTVLVLPILE